MDLRIVCNLVVSIDYGLDLRLGMEGSMVNVNVVWMVYVRWIVVILMM